MIEIKPICAIHDQEVSITRTKFDEFELLCSTCNIRLYEKELICPVCNSIKYYLAQSPLFPSLFCSNYECSLWKFRNKSRFYSDSYISYDNKIIFLGFKSKLPKQDYKFKFIFYDITSPTIEDLANAIYNFQKDLGY